MSNIDKGKATLDQRGNILHISKRGGQQDSTVNEGAVVLELIGDLAASGQASGTTAGTECERTWDQAGTAVVPEIIASRQKVTGEGNRNGH